MDTTGLIIDDRPEGRAWLRDLATEAFPGLQPRSVGSLARAYAALQEQNFGLVLTDLALPDGSAIDLIGHIARHHPGTFPVVVTAQDDDRHILGALQSGAAGYLLKHQPWQELVPQLRRVFSGDPPLAPAVARRVLHLFRNPPSMTQPEIRPSGLSTREVEVLCLLARGLTRQDIAQALEIRPNTVAGHIKAIYRKLEVSGRAEATLAAVRLGLVRGREWEHESLPPPVHAHDAPADAVASRGRRAG